MTPGKTTTTIVPKNPPSKPKADLISGYTIAKTPVITWNRIVTTIFQKLESLFINPKRVIRAGYIFKGTLKNKFIAIAILAIVKGREW